MTTTTQCPVCGTRFKATQAQLEAYHGMVRCGHCHAAFNAIENRTSAEPSPQLDLPIVAEDTTPPRRQPAAAPAMARRGAEAEPLPGAPEAPAEEAARPPRAWLWKAASVLLALAALAQLTYLFRTELAARLPGLKPALVAACARLHCNVPLPRNIDLMSIDASNMETDPAQPGVITLSLTLHNLAPYPQAYPALELTLTDISDMPVGRRLFRPGEYLKDAADATQGLGANRDTSIRLAIDATGLRAAGYRLFLTY
jgi:predicted Zn finger-like uncharacterized protein